MRKMQEESMNWRHKKLTFMVIPDANSQVVRFQLSSAALLAGVAFFSVLLISSIVVVLLYWRNSSQVETLQNKLSAYSGEYERTIEKKDKHINDLQTEIASLSEQAHSINNRMADIKKLESQLKQMAGIEAPSSPSDQEESVSDSSMDGGGTGGDELPVTDEEMDLLIEQTRDSFDSIGTRLTTLGPELAQTKSDIQSKMKKLSATPSIWPTVSQRITSEFGVRKDPFTGRATFHAGIDFGGDIGDPIYAAADGVVQIAERDDAHGNYVEIRHANGISTKYLHMSKILTKIGEKVRKGDVIGKLGSTGRSTGPHLHYEVSIYGSNVDPRPYLKATRRSNG
jgi:septal ring factor EnvC (AmiA/AmiB activator)